MNKKIYNTMNTRNIVKNIRSAEVIQGKPKLPTTTQLSEGEIAVNYAKGYETLSFKNNSDEIVSLSVKTVDDVTVNGNSVVSNKTANITMKGSTTPVADTYSTTTFPSSFDYRAEHISATDKVDVALKKVETNISKLVDKLDFYYSNLNNDVTNLQNQINSLRGMVFVDLGLPSGTLWAKCNIGAETETDYGDYFMWGSTTPNTASECTWKNAPFNGGNTSYNETYFNSVKDTVWPNGILAKGYDVAYKTTNGAARMPTEAEFIELIYNTNKEWTQVSDVNGWKFTSKTDTSKYIFIPAAGYYHDGSVADLGDYGEVWSSSLNTSNPHNAWCLNFDSVNSGMTNDSRYFGQSVRAVRNLPL